MLIVNVTDADPSLTLARAAAVAMTVHTPFCPTTTIRSARRWQKEVLGEPIV